MGVILTDGNKLGTGGGSSQIIVVQNFSALPDPTTVAGKFYWASETEGTKWLPGSLGGTFYNSGLYYSNGISWEYQETPHNATLSQVNVGTNTTTFVTPFTFTNASKWDTKENILTAGTNITIDRTNPAAPIISATSGANEVKYHLKTGDDFTIEECIQYFLYRNLIIDSGVTLTIDDGGQLAVHNGIIENDGTIINDGLIINE